MNTSLAISLDTRRAKKDGTFPLVMRLTHYEKTTAIPIGISLLEKDWNAKDRKVKASYGGVSSVTRLNNQLQKQKADAMDIILKLQEAEQLQSMSVTDLREKIEQKNTGTSFFHYAEGFVKELRKANRFGTADSYSCAAGVLKVFNKDKDISFQQITYSFLTKFETHHIGKGNSYNSLGVYMRSIRAIYNRAMKEGLVEKSLYPFENYKIRKEPTRKRALDAGNLAKIKVIDVNAEKGLFNACNYFLASYMMYGMNYADMAYLEKTDIRDGRVYYSRSKTGKVYDIKITPQLEKILAHYISLHPDSLYLFPILKPGTAEEQHEAIKASRRQYNNNLKKLAVRCGIETEMTSYVSRHSFATQAMLQDVPVNVISAMLGHSSLTTTEIYLKSLPTNILDDYNSKIL